MKESDAILSGIISGYEIVSRVVIIAATPEEILIPNPRRWSFVVACSGAAGIFPTNTNGTVNVGIETITPFRCNVRDDGPLPMYGWSIVNGVALEVLIIEVIKI